MRLRSNLFRGDARLEAAAAAHPAHVLRGAAGAHVGKIQRALAAIDGEEIADGERSSQTFGASTERAVLRFKTKRRIVNTAYQSTPDAIVGVMTMRALDDELVRLDAAAAEATVWCAIATALGYSVQQPRVVTNDVPLRSTVATLQGKA